MFFSAFRKLSGARALSLALLMLLPQRYAWADLMLHPTRLVFEKNQRSAQLELINNGKEAATYRLSLVNRRMGETGAFTAITTPGPGEQFADGMLRYSPRQVTLAPGASQVVRIMVRKPAELAAGEYRSHLQIDKLPDPGSATSINNLASANSKEIGVVITTLIGASVPVIVRHGQTDVAVTLAKLELIKPAAGQPALLSAVLQRSGNRSLYGDLAATFTPRGGTTVELGNAKGVAVYTPNASRTFQLELHPPKNVELSNGTVRLTLRERPETGDKLLAEAVIALP